VDIGRKMPKPFVPGEGKQSPIGEEEGKGRSIKKDGRLRAQEASRPPGGRGKVARSTGGEEKEGEQPSIKKESENVIAEEEIEGSDNGGIIHLIGGGERKKERASRPSTSPGKLEKLLALFGEKEKKKTRREKKEEITVEKKERFSDNTILRGGVPIRNFVKRAVMLPPRKKGKKKRLNRPLRT